MIRPLYRRNGQNSQKAGSDYGRGRQSDRLAEPVHSRIHQRTSRQENGFEGARAVPVPKEIFPSSYECNCGHLSHFAENTSESRFISATTKNTLSCSIREEWSTSSVRKLAKPEFRPRSHLWLDERFLTPRLDSLDSEPFPLGRTQRDRVYRAGRQESNRTGSPLVPASSVRTRQSLIRLHIWPWVRC
jgi:hypothetical protein